MIRLLLVLLSWSQVTQARDHQQCLKAIHHASKQRGVSHRLLYKIAQVESGLGRGRLPWPWTLNIHGKAYYFKDSPTTLKVMHRLLARGITNFDVGCFQINWRWHGHKVKDPASLLHPHHNALIAAHYLQELYAKHRSLIRAVALYHSSDPGRGARYARRIFYP